MMPFPDPRPWLAMLVVGGAGFLGGEWREGRAGAAQRQAADGAAKLELAIATDRVRETERHLTQNLATIDAARTKEQDHAQETIDSLRADVRNGAIRLSVATRPGDPAAASGHSGAGDSEARAELVPSAALALIDIAADGDWAVRELNACIDKYDAVRRSVNP
ncbi:hypothetical protein AAKU55_005250 [Oxalobacteraceae bacterium GrIS 1.11]